MADEKEDKTLDDKKPKEGEEEEEEEKKEAPKKDSALASVDKALGDEVAKEAPEEEGEGEEEAGDSIQIKITLDIPKVFFELMKKTKPKNNKPKK